MFRSHFMIFLSLAFLSFPVAIAQDSEEFDEPLSKKQAEKTVKLAEDALKDANRAQGRGDNPGMERGLEGYSSHMNKLESGLHDRNVLHDEHEDVAEVVAEATSKHMSTLKDLYEKVPPQGQAGIDRAYEVSQRGHDTALENLSEDRREELTQRHERQRASSSRATSSRSDDSLRRSGPSTGPGTVGGPGRGGSPQRGGSQGGNRGRR